LINYILAHLTHSLQSDGNEHAQRKLGPQAY